jgi:Tol biopolymer transport system component
VRGFTIVAALAVGSVGLACDNTALVGAQNPGLDGSANGNDASSTSKDAVGSSPDAGSPSNGSGGQIGTDAWGTDAPIGTVADGPIVIPGDSGAPAPWLFFDSLRSLNRDLYAVRADGSSLERLTTSPAIEREAALSPDGTTLAYSSDAGGTFQLYLMPLSSGVARQLTHRPEGAEQPSWSPDGKTLAFRSGRAVHIVDADGTNDRFVRYGFNDENACEHPAFTTDGRSLVYECSSSTFRYELAVQEETRIADFGAQPAISSDGATIAVVSVCNQSDRSAADPVIHSIWLAPLSSRTARCQGTPVTTVADGNARAPALSPEGRVAFEHGLRATRLGVVTPGGAIEDITSGGDDRNPSWAPASVVLP